MNIKKLILASLLLCFVVHFLAKSSNVAKKRRSSHFQLPKKGDQFIYKGIVKWEVANEPRQKEVSWPVEVVRVKSHRNYFIAEIKGFPSDLMGFDETDGSDPTPEDYYYIVNKRSQTICIADFLPALNQRELKQWNGSLIYLNLSESPRGKRCYLDWVLESKKRVNVNELKGVPRREYLRYRFGARTLSDSEIIDFTPEIGVIAYKYIHYGSICEVDNETDRNQAFKIVYFVR